MRVLLLNLGYIHAKNLNGFRAMCHYVGATLVESSKLEEVADGTWDLVWIPAGYVAPGRFSQKTKRIILGPHNFVFPEPPWTVVAFKDPRASYNCLSRWNQEAYTKMGGVADLPLVCQIFHLSVCRIQLIRPALRPLWRRRTTVSCILNCGIMKMSSLL